MSEYYTPKIEDITVGMIVQIHEQSTSKMIRQVEWHDVMVTENENELTQLVAFNRLKRLINNNKLRVKKLDEQDIKDIGGKLRHNPTDSFNLFFYYKEIHSIILNPKNQWCLITVRSEARQEDYTGFCGFIDNITELKKILTKILPK